MVLVDLAVHGYLGLFRFAAHRDAIVEVGLGWGMVLWGGRGGISRWFSGARLGGTIIRAIGSGVEIQCGIHAQSQPHRHVMLCDMLGLLLY